MRLAALRDSPSAFGTTFESALSRTPESWSEQADGTSQGSDRATFIAFSDEFPVGIASLYRQEATDVGELLHVWVSPEWRGRGVAADLVETLLGWAGENGFTTVVAVVAKGNVRALKFYRRVGFEPEGGAPGGPDDPVVLTIRNVAR